MSIALSDITGLVLAGGRGTRMGGVDKGLQMHLGVPLAQHALQRLRPQVGALAVNANRHLAQYEAMGVPVWPDALAEYPGPLAGMLAGMQRCRTPYLVTVPCDTPNFPLDLVARLAGGFEPEGDMAMAVAREDGVLHRQPVFILMKIGLRESAAAFLQSGRGKIGLWASQHRCSEVIFEDASAFFNANTSADLAQLQARPD
ncbi:MAG: molybdenum cofactor guanylyltransferase MobA [Pseudomonadota bacterium]|nr:molybdenum cofactor guanylyltransferase MobA [Pseudomonadota bacterium]